LLIEFTRFLLIDICLILAFLGTFRLPTLPRFIAMCLRWGLLLVLAEYVIRIAVGLLIGFVDRNHFANLDFARSS
jgi:hypothetical protein